MSNLSVENLQDVKSANKNILMSLSKNQKQVFQKDTMIKLGIEMIGVINNRGGIVDLIGFDSLNMSKAKKEMFLMKIALRSSMQNDFDEDLGKVDYCMTQRGDRKFISIPTPDNNTILAVIKNNCNHEELVNYILLTLKDSVLS